MLQYPLDAVNLKFKYANLVAWAFNVYLTYSPCTTSCASLIPYASPALRSLNISSYLLPPPLAFAVPSQMSLSPPVMPFTSLLSHVSSTDPSNPGSSDIFPGKQSIIWEPRSCFPAAPGASSPPQCVWLLPYCPLSDYKLPEVRNWPYLVVYAQLIVQSLEYRRLKISKQARQKKPKKNLKNGFILDPSRTFKQK